MARLQRTPRYETASPSEALLNCMGGTELQNALDQAQQTSSKTAKDTVENLLDSEQETVDNLVKADNQTA